MDVTFIFYFCSLVVAGAIASAARENTPSGIVAVIPLAKIHRIQPALAKSLEKQEGNTVKKTEKSTMEYIASNAKTSLLSSCHAFVHVQIHFHQPHPLVHPPHLHSHIYIHILFHVDVHIHVCVHVHFHIDVHVDIDVHVHLRVRCHVHCHVIFVLTIFMSIFPLSVDVALCLSFMSGVYILCYVVVSTVSC